MKLENVSGYISNWLADYCNNAHSTGFVVGISGGVDSAVTSVLCANTSKKVILVSMPIRQTTAEFRRASDHIENLKSRFSNVEAVEINLTDSFSQIEKSLPKDVLANFLAMANTRSRLRMLTLYAIAQTNNCLVAGTGNRVEDFGVGFYTKYGDGGVDLSPIADLTKTQVWQLARHLEVIDSIIVAKPTDGLWEDGRSDEEQIGATYSELEWAMDFHGSEDSLIDREKEVLAIYRRLNKVNRHKMIPIPVCTVPKDYF